MEDKKNRIYKIIMLVILTAFVTFMITSFSLYSHFQNSNKNTLLRDLSNINLTNIKSDDNESGLEKYLKTIKKTIDNYYLWKDEIDEEELKKAAIEGYVSGLGDEYTEYIPADEMKSFTEEINGSFVGIGIYMVADKEKGRVLVYYPIPESPAEKSGLKSGDYIISVDGTEYTADDLNEISKYIKGKEGTKVNLEIERDGNRLSFDITREKITVNPITTKVIDESIGYLKLQSFDDDTSEQFKNKVQELQSQGATSLIIDLRNNGGGIVDEAINIADYMLEKGKTIYSTLDNKNNKEITKSENDPIFNMPVVILVNKNSASASEILVGCLQDNNRAKIVGTTTYGKGVIQTVFSLTDGSGLKITTQEYFTPNETKIHKVGITPDEEIELPENVKSIYVVEEDDDTQLKKAIESLK